MLISCRPSENERVKILQMNQQVMLDLSFIEQEIMICKRHSLENSIYN